MLTCEILIKPCDARRNKGKLSRQLLSCTDVIIDSSINFNSRYKQSGKLNFRTVFRFWAVRRLLCQRQHSVVPLLHPCVASN